MLILDFSTPSLLTEERGTTSPPSSVMMANGCMSSLTSEMSFFPSIRPYLRLSTSMLTSSARSIPSLKDLWIPRVMPCWILGFYPWKHREIKEVVFSFKPTKAPGPDAMHPFMYQNYWDILPPPPIDFCTSGLSSGRMEDGVNSTYLCLIPKCKNVLPLGTSDLLASIILNTRSSLRL